MTEWGSFEALDDLSPEELRQRLHSLQAIIARAPVPIAIAHDPSCRFISANHALGSLLRLPADANISLTPPPGERPLYRIQRNGRDIPSDELPMQYAIAHRASVSNDIEIVRADGSVLYVQNDVEPLYDTHGEIYGCVSVCVDLTGRRRSEIALRDADRKKDEFLATLSHELRNPLAPMRTAIVMRLAREDPDAIEKARATLDRQLRHLVRITDDLLDVSRITHDKLELRRELIDLRLVLHSAIEAMRPTIQEHAHQLTVNLPRRPLWANADFTRLSQAFSNLLSNAAKYTQRGGQIRVTATVDNDVATITVDDNGIGIPPPMLPRIFEMFTQLQQHRDRTYGGLGIGLTLARRLLELHGGTIQVISDGLGSGSRFVVQLPLTRGPRASEELRARDEQLLHAACRVLVAEDNPDAAEMLRVMLTFQGHDVRVAADGVEATAIAEEFEPHVALLDIGMPRMDGLEAARLIRERLGARVLLIALTGWGQDEDKRRSLDAGFDHHITKPPEPEALARLITQGANQTAARDKD
jgi:signal transduction histidine kinase/ActR/RegA family two-component response regulator